MVDYTAIGIRVRKIRSQMSLTQEELDEIADTSSTWVSSIENGKANPSVDVFYRVANALSVTVEYLITGKTQGRDYGLILPILDNFTKEEIPIVEKLLRDMLALKRK